MSATKPLKFTAEDLKAIDGLQQVFNLTHAQAVKRFRKLQKLRIPMKVISIPG